MNLNGNIMLPFAVQKGGGGRCKLCSKRFLAADILMTICEMSHILGMSDEWYHLACFWKTLDKDADDINARSISGLGHLSWDDQKKVREDIVKFKADYFPRPPLRGTQAVLSKTKVSLAASSRAKCGKCGKFIMKGTMKMLHNTKSFHQLCYYSSFHEIKGTVQETQGWDMVDTEERKNAIEEFEKFCKNKQSSSTGSVKIEPDDGYAEIDDKELADLTLCDQGYKRRSMQKRHSSKSEQEDTKRKKKEAIVAIRKEQLQAQATKLFELRKLFQDMNDNWLTSVLRANDQNVSDDRDQKLEHLVDIALFGCPIRCHQCNRGHFVFKESTQTYQCNGYKSLTLRCNATSKNPKRTPFELTPLNNRRNGQLDGKINVFAERVYPKAEEIVANPREGSRKSVLPAEMFTKTNKLPQNDAGSTAGVSNRHCLKNGTVVDMKFQHASICHVVKPYNVVLSFTDVVENKNSYFKMQLLKEDSQDKFHVFQSWGRVGTDLGGDCHDTFLQLSFAEEKFEEIFREKTGNTWQRRNCFRQMPGLFNIVETDHSELENFSEIVAGSRTLLPVRIKDVLLAIFDVTKMKKELKSFDMDIDRMPLGRLSNNQIMKAFEVLTLMGEFISKGEQETWQMLEATNQFYTLIPHNFGMKKPSAIDNLTMIHEKNRMLNMLLDIKFAYDQTVNVPLWKDPVDLSYESLRCEMKPLEKGGAMWKLIAQYIDNTHGETHRVRVDLLDILELQRHGEDEKFQKDLGNRKLLWHGSVITNIAGIMGQGLRIAPKEAPATGYMFGKGIYFADMFTKSFFYCRVKTVGEECYMILCEVALGNSHTLLKHDQNMSKEKLPPGTHSLHGLGRQCPAGFDSYSHPEGYTVPVGKPFVQLFGQHMVDFELLYNEYVVYDITQVRMKYLVRLKVHEARHLVL